MGVSFLPEHLQVGGWANQKLSPALSSPLMLRLFLFECIFSPGIFHILFSPLKNVSILMLNFTELMAADDYLNLILPKCALVSVR